MYPSCPALPLAAAPPSTVASRCRLAGITFRVQPYSKALLLRNLDPPLPQLFSIFGAHEFMPNFSKVQRLTRWLPNAAV